MPEVCVEIVSNKEGNEVALSAKSKRKDKAQSKRDIYAQIGVPYYVVYDPLQQIQDEANMNGALLRVWSLAGGRYEELTPAEGITTVGQIVQLETAGIGLTLWDGEYEEKITRQWLRWCDAKGQVLPTGAERANAQQQRADAQQQRAERLAAKLRELGIDPDEV